MPQIQFSYPKIVALNATDMKKERMRNLVPAKLSLHGMFIMGFNMIVMTVCLEFKVGINKVMQSTKHSKRFMYLCIYVVNKEK